MKSKEVWAHRKLLRLLKRELRIAKDDLVIKRFHVQELEIIDNRLVSLPPERQMHLFNERCQLVARAKGKSWNKDQTVLEERVQRLENKLNLARKKLVLVKQG